MNAEERQKRASSLISRCPCMKPFLPYGKESIFHLRFDCPHRARKFLVNDHNMVAAYCFLFCVKRAPEESPLRWLYTDMIRHITRKVTSFSHLSLMQRLCAEMASANPVKWPIPMKILAYTSMADGRLYNILAPLRESPLGACWAAFFIGCWRCEFREAMGDGYDRLLITSYDGPETIWYQPGRVRCCVECLQRECDLETIDKAMYRPPAHSYELPSASSKHAMVTSEDISEGKLDLYTLTREDGKTLLLVSEAEVARLRQTKSDAFLRRLLAVFPMHFEIVAANWDTMKCPPPRQSLLAVLDEPEAIWAQKSADQELENIAECARQIQKLAPLARPPAPGYNYREVQDEVWHKVFRDVGPWEYDDDIATRRLAHQERYTSLLKIYEDAYARRTEWLRDNPRPPKRLPRARAASAPITRRRRYRRGDLKRPAKTRLASGRPKKRAAAVAPGQ